MKTFKEYIDNITKMQKEWNKPIEPIDAAAPIEQDYTDLSYLYDDVVESPTNDVAPNVEEVVEEKPINPHRL